MIILLQYLGENAPFECFLPQHKEGKNYLSLGVRAKKKKIIFLEDLLIMAIHDMLTDFAILLLSHGFV